MLNTFAIFYASAVMLSLLVLLCVYLLFENYRAKRTARRKENFLDNSRATWTKAIFDEEKVEIECKNTEEEAWAIEYFLSLLNDLQDERTRSRITGLANELFTPHLANQLRSPWPTVRQHALVVSHQLRISALSDDLMQLSTGTGLEKYLGMPTTGEHDPKPAPQAAIEPPTTERRSVEVLDAMSVNKGVAHA